MQKKTSNTAWAIPKLPRQRTKYQFSLKTLLVAFLLAGPLVAFFAEPAFTVVRGILSIQVSSPSGDEVQPALKFAVIFALMAGLVFGLVPYCFSKLHPVIALACSIVGGFAVPCVWYAALVKIESAFYAQASQSKLSDDMVREAQRQALNDLGLAIAATFLLLGIIVGGIISLRSRECF